MPRGFTERDIHGVSMRIYLRNGETREELEQRADLLASNDESFWAYQADQAARRVSREYQHVYYEANKDKIKEQRKKQYQRMKHSKDELVRVCKENADMALKIKNQEERIKELEELLQSREDMIKSLMNNNQTEGVPDMNVVSGVEHGVPEIPVGTPKTSGLKVDELLSPSVGKMLDSMFGV